MFTIALRNEPWQWTYKPFTTISYLTDPRTNLYKNYKMRIEKAVSIFHNFLTYAPLPGENKSISTYIKRKCQM